MEELVNKVNSYLANRNWYRVELKGSPLHMPISRQTPENNYHVSKPCWLIGDYLYSDEDIEEAIIKLIRVYSICEVEL